MGFFATEDVPITTNDSKFGPTLMAVEWTIQIAYDPMLIAIFMQIPQEMARQSSEEHFVENISLVEE